MNLNNISIVLCRPQLGENIGAAARIMKNFAISDLRIVNPRDGWPNDRAEAMSAGAKDLISNAKIFDSLEEAIEDISSLYGATARVRGFNKKTYSPRSLAENLKKQMNPDFKAGIMFGNEANGLSNEEVSHCNGALSIPVNEEYSSLNLAQAIAVTCYEIYQKTQYEGEEDEPKKAKNFELPNGSDVNLLVSILEGIMDESNFYSVPKKRDGMVMNVRNMFTNNQFTKQEIKTLIGILKKES